jgi:hypothetical protein
VPGQGEEAGWDVVGIKGVGEEERDDRERWKEAGQRGIKEFWNFWNFDSIL